MYSDFEKEREKVLGIIYPKIKLIVPKTQLSGPGAYVVTVLTILQQLTQATLLVGNCVKHGCHSSGVLGGS